MKNKMKRRNQVPPTASYDNSALKNFQKIENISIRTDNALTIYC
jgi:hypothetical protein